MGFAEKIAVFLEDFDLQDKPLTLEEIKSEIKRLYAEVRMKTNRIEELIAQWEGVEKIKGEHKERKNNEKI